MHVGNVRCARHTSTPKKLGTSHVPLPTVKEGTGNVTLATAASGSIGCSVLISWTPSTADASWAPVLELAFVTAGGSYSTASIAVSYGVPVSSLRQPTWSTTGPSAD
jgi:hypothetical protein